MVGPSLRPLPRARPFTAPAHPLPGAQLARASFASSCPTDAVPGDHGDRGRAAGDGLQRAQRLMNRDENGGGAGGSGSHGALGLLSGGKCLLLDCRPFLAHSAGYIEARSTCWHHCAAAG